MDLFGPQIAKFTKAWIDPGSTINFGGLDSRLHFAVHDWHRQDWWG